MKSLITRKKKTRILPDMNACKGFAWSANQNTFLLPLLWSRHLIILYLFAGCWSRDVDSAGALFNELDSEQTGITFINRLDETDSLNILEYLYYYNGAGVAAGDVNNDGFADLYFVSNRDDNKLYINEGKHRDFSYKDISLQAGVTGRADWQTGVTMADVNGDGWLDIYVCAVSSFKGMDGSNELYINNGINTKGEVTFTESAAEYGLDFSGFSTQAVFFDFDKDTDLDMFLLNHSVHTSASYEVASNRIVRDSLAGDYLFENRMINYGKPTSQRRFKDVTSKSGILQASMGYGLGVAVADFNNDGWDDIYVANDFHEDDYYYLNNGDGSFAEGLKDNFGHVSRFSMGCDAGDINHDGYMDLMTLDMYPADETIEKSSAGEDPFDIFLFKLKYGYYYQYSRNCMQLNNAGQAFSDIANLAGVAATDWSWSTLIADFDNDGHNDIFISNGIPRRPNDLDYIKFISNNAKWWTKENVKAMDQQAINMMPEGRVPNYFYKGNGSLRFEDQSLMAGFTQPTTSNGAAHADLDNDGDLDIITNNLNERASIFKNESDTFYEHAFLKVRLKGHGANSAGIGAKVYVKTNSTTYLQQLMPTRGFMSSSDAVLNFGLGKASRADTVIVVWPDRKAQLIRDVLINGTIEFDQRAAHLEVGQYQELLYPSATQLLEEATEKYEIKFIHRENIYYDFYKESLIPFQVSSEGPHIATGDVTGDGLDDFYVGGARNQAGKLFIQKPDGRFRQLGTDAFDADSAFEDVDAAFFDADGDHDLDLYVVSGGNEFQSDAPNLSDRMYINDGNGNFRRDATSIPSMRDSKSCVRPSDFDGDGDMDLFVGGRVVSQHYGYAPHSYLLVNNGYGKFSDQTAQIAPGLVNAGMITDAHWFDWDNDKDDDLMVVGDWMPVQVFSNDGNQLIELQDVKGLESSNGLWQTLEPTDLDKDGDLDFLIGNVGTNTKLRKGEKPELRLYVKDIDNNGSLEHILAYKTNKKWYPAASKDELSKQLPLIRKIFSDYKSFAGKTIAEIFSNGELDDALILTINNFSSIWLENAGNKKFIQHSLPDEVQITKVFAFHPDDFDKDGDTDILVGGNFYGTSVYQGRYDAGYGLMLINHGTAFESLPAARSGFFIKGEIRDLKSVTTKAGSIILVARNNLNLQVFNYRQLH
jgi:enediyne biosynthesis protein E4